MPSQPTPAPPIELRLTGEQIPRMRRAVEAALDELNPAIRRLELDGRIRDPWLGDETSAAFVAYYNHEMMDKPGSARAHVVAFRDELLRVRDALAAAERTYQDTEAGIVTRMTQI